MIRQGNVRAKEFRAKLRRQAQLRAAADVIPHLPGPGESVHTLLTGSFDFLMVLTCVIQSRPARCDALRLATLAFSRKNTEELCRLLDANQVGKLTLLASDFMARSNEEIYQGAVGELVGQRGQIVASSRCHAKVACLAFGDGLRLAFEGSMNLRRNGNIEVMTVINDPHLHDWHAAWIDERSRNGKVNKS